MQAIWNEVVASGDAFPQVEPLDRRSASRFFAEQTITGVAVEGDVIVGLYILHPNNVGRCSHVANASYAVSSQARGKGVGRRLVLDSLNRCRAEGFRGLQFNAVVESNTKARRLYEDLGFTDRGMIPGGFLMPDGTYEDIHIYFHDLDM